MLRLLAAFALTVPLLHSAAPAQAELRPGPWQTAGKVPAGWVVHNTRFYHVQSQCGPDKARRLGEHMELMNAVYKKMFKPGKDGAKQYTIKLFKDEKSYLAYGAPEGAAAYYSWTEREMVCYDSGKWSDEEQKPETPKTGPETHVERMKRLRSRIDESMKMDVLGTAAHEGWHQFFDWMVGSKVEMPSWIEEGVGDYFDAAAPNRTKGAKKGSAELGRMNDGRLWIVQEAKKQGALVPLTEFVSMLQSAYYNNPDVCYAQGWAFCQFLLHGEKGKYAKIIPEYVRLIANDSNWRAVTEKAFKGVDMAQLEKEFHAYVDTLVPTAPNPFDLPLEEEEEAPAPPKAPPGSGGGSSGGGGDG
jgi:hypothetical protein